MIATAETGPSRHVEESILAELTSAPVAEPTLESRVRTSVRGLSVKAYKAVLAALVAAKKIHGRPKVGKNGRPTKSVESYALGAPPPPPPPPEELAPQAILDALQSGALAPADLKARVKASVIGLSAKAYDEVLRKLLAESKIHARNRVGRNGRATKTPATYALGEPPPVDPGPFVAPVLKLWSKACGAAREARVSEAALLEALLSGLGVRAAAVERAQEPTAEAREQVLRTVRELVAYEGTGSLIPIRRLRAATRLDKSVFDAAVLELRGDAAIILHHHDFVGSLSDAERAELVLDAYGNHYVGIALRGVS